MSRLSRRAWLLGAGSCAIASHGAALGRTPRGGTLRLTLPWALASLDPHAPDDVAGALFASAVTDATFALDDTGRAYPTLARAMPRLDGGQLFVELRPGLLSARGRPLDARDLRASLLRAKSFGALTQLPEPRFVTGNPLGLTFTGAEPARLAVDLASPLAALLPTGFDPAQPDGTGALRASFAGGKLVLTRNPHAARGAAFVDQIVVSRGTDLADCLRAFETGDADLGWLGAGLHRRRTGAIDFDAGRFAWVVLYAGSEAGSAGTAGALQALCDAIDPALLGAAGVEAFEGARGGDARFRGETQRLLVSADAPQLVRLARELASALGSTGPLTLDVKPRAEFRDLRRSKRFSLALDVARSVNDEADPTLLLASSSLDLARRPPRGPFDARRLGRSSPFGVLGALRLRGARLPKWRGIERGRWGEVWLAR